MSKVYLEAPEVVEGATAADAPEASTIGNFKFALPKKAFKLKCVEATFGKSKVKADGSGGNPMITRKWQIVAPEKVMIKVGNEGNREEKVVAGCGLMDWLTLTAKTKNIVIKDSTRLGVEPPDDEMPNLKAYEGVEAMAICSTKVAPEMDEETGEPILNTKGEAVVKFQHNITEWLD